MVIYRPGAVTAAAIECATGATVMIYRPSEKMQQGEPSALPSPGVGMRHYAPNARFVLAEGSAEGLQRAVSEAVAAGGAVGVLLPSGWELEGLEGKVVVEPWAAWENADALAAKLFGGLRALADRGVVTVVAPLPKEGPGMIAALRDRMMKAARAA
jgi:L-threonylcarbamoyladenylate synthase